MATSGHTSDTARQPHRHFQVILPLLVLGLMLAVVAGKFARRA